MPSSRPRAEFAPHLLELHACGDAELSGNFICAKNGSELLNQGQTNSAFSEKWSSHAKSKEQGAYRDLQKRWYLELYGFATERDLGEFLRSKSVIFDAGCGLGFKSAWFAELAPDSLVVGMDFSEAARLAAVEFEHVPNLFFIQGDIAETGFRDGGVDYTVCDQVIQHTENPDATFAELVRITNSSKGEVACYFYAKKALPRELVDDYFRTQCSNMSHGELWALSEQLTELGRRLSALDITFEAPEIPALGIKAGTYDIQRFLYWNFLKCYWNAELGLETSIAINFDWYSPSNARRYSRDEVLELVASHALRVEHFHEEEACYSGRFAR